MTARSRPLLFALLIVAAVLVAVLARGVFAPAQAVSGLGPAEAPQGDEVLDTRLPEPTRAAAEPDSIARAPAAAEEPTERRPLAPTPRRERPVALPVPEPEDEPEPEPLEVAGDITGRLLREVDPWTAETLPDLGGLVVELVRLEEPRLELRADVQTTPVEDGSLELTFAFRDVPIGEYELGVFSLGAWPWEPRSLRIRAPAAGLVLVRQDAVVAPPLEFVVRDAESGELIEDFEVRHLEQTVSEESGVFMHAGPLEGGAFPRGTEFRWSLWADRYRPTFGDERAFEDVDGRRVARVDLERGWAARLVVLGREPTLRPLYRAKVSVDGRFVGVTAQDGSLVVQLAAPPERLEVDYRGWELLNDPLDPRPGTTPELRGFVYPLIVGPPE